MRPKALRAALTCAALSLIPAGPVLCPLAHSRPADSGQVWYGPSMGSFDMLQLFTDPGQWDSARARIDVFQFLAHHVNSWPCMAGLCNSNTLVNLVNVQAFTRLGDWGIDIAIEGAGILPQTPFGTPVDCSVEREVAVQNAFAWTVDAVANVQANGGTVRYIAIDEPIRRWYSPIYPPSGGPACKTESLAEIADMVADFITLMNSAAPSIGVGQIILYPELGVAGIKEYVTQLEGLGIHLPFVHLDVHGLRIIEYTGPVYGRVTLAQVKADLLELESFFHARNTSFAPILTDLLVTTRLYPHGAYTDSVYYENTMSWIHEVRSTFSRPDHLIFESWARPQYSDTDLVSVITPLNLPEDDTSVFSHTRLIHQGLAIFDPPAPACCCEQTGDSNADGVITAADIIYLVGYVLKGGPLPLPCAAVGDVNCDGRVTSSDIIYAVTHVFKGGAAPCEVCALIPGTWVCP